MHNKGPMYFIANFDKFGENVWKIFGEKSPNSTVKHLNAYIIKWKLKVPNRIWSQQRMIKITIHI